MTEELPVAAGDVVMVSLDEAAYAGLTAGSVAEPGVDASIVVVVPDVPPRGSTQVVITGIRYGLDAPLMDAFGHGLPHGLPA
ncbi:hypothetical protein [Halobaculum sp. D14]|uniref:hypothetical protein n=1 Tax=Halobaculum sp. D14 TaxID=3421642 RepID=UPI003EBF3504